MPLDPRIPLGVQPAQFNSPFQRLAEIRQQQQQQEIQQQAIRSNQALEEERRARTAKQTRDDAKLAAQDEAITAVFADPNPKPSAIMKAAGAERGIPLVNGLAALRRGREGDLRDVILGFARLPDAVKATAYGPVIQQLIADERIRPEDAPEQWDLEWFARIVGQGQELPKPDIVPVAGPDGKPVYGPKVAGAPVYEKPETITPYQQAQLDRQTEAAKEAARHNRSTEANQRLGASSATNEPLETIIGPDGKPIRVRRSDAVGQPPASGTEKASSGVQKRVLNFFNRARQADEELEAMEGQIQKLGIGSQTRLEYAPNFAQTQLGQAYGAAQRAFTEARLRKDSGAAIPEQEFKNDRETYFQKTGDSPATLEQKRRARAAILSSLGFESGQALGEFIGDPDEAKALVEKYKARSAMPTANKIGRFEIVN